MGHIIYKDGIRVDLDRVKEIMKVKIPSSKNEVQSFIGQVNFLRIFVPSFTKILRNATNMLRKDSNIKWTIEEKNIPLTL